MRRPNLDKMRKHSARGVPDKVTRPIGGHEELIKFKVWFQQKMWTKHGERGVIIASVRDDIVSFSGDTESKVTLEWKHIHNVTQEEYIHADMALTMFGMNYDYGLKNLSKGFLPPSVVIDELRRH